jgi:hypothetical protein
MSIAEFYIENCLDPDRDLCEQLRSPFYFTEPELPWPEANEECLIKLATLAGVPTGKAWSFQEDKLDKMALSKEWDKIACPQPAMASYSKDGVRLNFYLSTGTVGSCLDHPTKGKTQLFRKNVTDPAALFDKPRQHTDKGYHTTDKDPAKGTKNNKRKVPSEEGPSYVIAANNKRKAPYEEGRTCAQCGETKPFDSFSKNQRKKGSSARCKSCV